MEFGRVSEQELDSINFTLPPDPAVTTEVLKTGKGNTQFWIGCAKWGRKDWVGKLYPPGTKDKDFLEHYARLFNCIEMNATFYKSPAPADVLRWKSKVPKGFKFFPKFPQTITHLKRLKNTGLETGAFLEAITEFGYSLGPIFLMPHPQMGVKHFDTIRSFMDDFPQDVPLFLELRHDDVYANGYDNNVFSYLKANNRGTIITDAAGKRDYVHMHLSTPECFIRFVGNSLHTSDYTRIDDWVQRIKIWMEQGLEKCYFFMHQHEELHSPKLIKYLIEQLNKHCGISLTPPRLYNEGTLF